MSHEILAVGAGGEYMESVTVVEWAAKEGDQVRRDDVLVVVETAKAATEILAPADGILSKIVAVVGDEVAIGAVLGYIGDAASAPAPVAPGVDEVDVASASTPERAVQAPVAAVERATGRVIASPLARRLARAQGVDLATVRGSGAQGRIKARDVQGVAPSASAPVVFLHGFGADSRAWQKLLVQLPRDVRVLALDLPGHGAAWEHSARSLDELTQVIEHALAEAGIREAHLVGHSLGGAVCLNLIRRNSLQVRSLALLAPAGLGAEIDGAFIDGFARASCLESLQPWLGRLVANPADLPKGFAEETQRARDHQGLRDAQRQLGATLFPDGTQAQSLREVIGGLEVPVKVIWGLQDAIIPWRHVLGLPGAVGVHLLPGTGHMPHLEQSRLVGRLLGELLRSAA